MKIYLVRHGLSEGNKARIYQSADTGLSPEGKDQAKAIAERISNLPIDFIYASSLKRAQETAKIISGRKNLKIETWEEIREITRPSVLRGKHADSPESKAFEEAEEKNYANPDWKHSDDESFSELKTRAGKVLAHLVKNHQNQNILMVSHGTFIKYLISYVLFGEKLTPEMFWTFRKHTYAENTGISVCEYRTDRGWKLLTFSDVSHL